MIPPDELIPTITSEMVAKTEQEIAAKHEGREGSPLKDIKNARCKRCGENAVCFVDDLLIVIGNTDVPNLTGLRCAVCGDRSFDAGASKIISDMRQMQRLEKIPTIPELTGEYKTMLNEDRGYGDYE